MAVVTVALLVLGVAAQLVGSLGAAAMRDPLDRLHYTGTSVLATAAVAGAILSEEGFSLIADKALILAAAVAISSPVTIETLARAIRVCGRGDLGAEAADVERLR